MNFQQLRIIRETVRRNFNLTEVANALHTSQSGVSKHIKDLEDELGIELFVRRGKRLLGLTEPGKELVGIVQRMLLYARNIKQLAEQFASADLGELTVATTHHGELKAFAHSTPGLTNASVEFNIETLSPTYHLTIGLPGRSNALEIATRLGMPREIIDEARASIAPAGTHRAGCPS